MTGNLFFKISRKSTLDKAWKKVRTNGLNSPSEETQNAVKLFDTKHDVHIKKIQEQLKKNKYIFSPVKGVLKKRKDKAPRPLVISEIRDRIVQRSILDVLQSVDSIKKYVNVPTSFGGIEDLSVRDAIEKVCKNIKSGCKYYICSDIKDFFIKIPRLKVIDIIMRLLPDDSLKNILQEASKTELENLANVRFKNLFPTHELGVPQGCSLSPLMGNILLHDLDVKLNSKFRHVICLRFIDDIVILSPTETSARKVYVEGRKILKKYAMDLYDPSDRSGKASAGRISKGFEYLGCFINESFVHPKKESRSNLKQRVRELLDISTKRLATINSSSWKREYSHIRTLQKISNILMGWGHQYSYCNAKDLFRELDKEIDKYIKNYSKNYETARKKLAGEKNADVLRRLLGIHLLSESKSKPILPLK